TPRERAALARFAQLTRGPGGGGIRAPPPAVAAGAAPPPPADPQADCRFIEEPDPQQAIARIVDVVIEELPATTGCDPLSDIQVLCPLNQGEAGTVGLNPAVQSWHNPLGLG